MHKLTHTGIKPFMCEDKNCDRRFTSKGNMKSHLKVHFKNYVRSNIEVVYINDEDYSQKTTSHSSNAYLSSPIENVEDVRDLYLGKYNYN